ncbi:hypothetical protein GEV33_013946 [Tenebrio molitor]|uniref:Uncharacterized protein n=1 Tax=Tenebrio molitor TaxID=7067 RepID=A0A8J6H672_TENMO|nr:hypothetical protein GEV33_013946 [Tenebrio molitor]
MHSPHAASAEKDRQCKRAVLTVLASTLQLSPHRLKTRRTSLRFGPQMYDLCIWLPPTAIPKDVSHQRQVPSCHEPKVFHPNLVRGSVEAVDAAEIMAQDKVKKKEQLKKRDKNCKSQIVQRVADSHFEYVKDKETAFEIWTKLKNTFERQSLGGELLLRKELLLMKYSPAKETLETHFLKFDRVMRDLRSTGAKMEEQDIVCHLLLTMPGKYDSVITALETLSSEKLTLSFMRTRLPDEDMKREGKQRKNKTETQPPLAFATPEGTKQKWKHERLEINLLSVRTLEMQGLAVVFKQGCGRILKGDKIIGIAQCRNKLYELKLQENVEVANLSKTDGSAKLWHHRHGQRGNSKLQKLSQIVDGVESKRKSRTRKNDHEQIDHWNLYTVIYLDLSLQNPTTKRNTS